MTDIKPKITESVKNSASNIVVAACFLSGVAFFDFSLFIPVIIFILGGLALVKWPKPLVAFLLLVTGIYYAAMLSSDLSQLGLTKLALIGWVCFAAGHAFFKAAYLSMVQNGKHI
jgi:hypothetical protein